jgi:hypothetical protein
VSFANCQFSNKVENYEAHNRATYNAHRKGCEMPDFALPVCALWQHLEAAEA